MEFNKQLKKKITWLRTQLPFAKFSYVDVYSAKYDLISNAKKLGKNISYLDLNTSVGYESVELL